MAMLIMFYSGARQSKVTPRSAAAFDPTRNTIRADVAMRGGTLYITQNWAKNMQANHQNRLLALTPTKDPLRYMVLPLLRRLLGRLALAAWVFVLGPPSTCVHIQWLGTTQPWRYHTSQRCGVRHRPTSGSTHHSPSMQYERPQPQRHTNRAPPNSRFSGWGMGVTGAYKIYMHPRGYKCPSPCHLKGHKTNLELYHTYWLDRLI